MEKIKEYLEIDYYIEDKQKENKRVKLNDVEINIYKDKIIKDQNRN